MPSARGLFPENRPERNEKAMINGPSADDYHPAQRRTVPFVFPATCAIVPLHASA